MSTIGKHFTKIDFHLNAINDEIATIEKHKHITNGAVFARIKDIEIDVTKAREAVYQHINCEKEKNDGK